MAASNAYPCNNNNVEKLRPTDLKYLKDHLRRHSRSQIETACRIIAQVGFLVPVIISKDDEIIDGALRVTAAIELGLETIPVLRQDKATPVQLKMIRLASNKMAEGSTWDEGLLKPFARDLIGHGINLSDLGMSNAEIDALFPTLHQSDEAVVEALLSASSSEYVSRLGDVFAIGAHKLACADTLNSTAIDALMLGETADASFMDVPYNVPIRGFVSGNGRADHDEFQYASGDLTRQQFLEFLRKVIGQGNRVTRPGGLHYLCIDWRSIDLIMAVARELLLDHLNTCVWTKSNAGMGSFYRSQHEFVGVFRKPGGRSTNNVQLGKYGRNRSNVWSYAGANAFGATRDQDLADHPTVKPTPLVEDAIKDCTKRGDIVIDFFGGSGTTMLAAERCNRKARLVEIEPRYVDVTIKRMRQAFGLDATHVETGLTFNQLAEQRGVAVAT